MYKKNVIVNCNPGRSNSLKLALEAYLNRMLVNNSSNIYVKYYKLSQRRCIV